MASPSSTQIRARLALKKQVVAHLNQDKVMTRTLCQSGQLRTKVSPTIRCGWKRDENEGS